MPGLSISFPAYNERENIGSAIEAAVRVASQLTDDFEVIVVDDGSADDTAGVVREYAERYPQVRLVQHEVNQGYGAAVFDGHQGMGFLYRQRFAVRDGRTGEPVGAQRRGRSGHRLPRTTTRSLYPQAQRIRLDMAHKRALWVRFS